MIERRFLKISNIEVSYLESMPANPQVTVIFIHGFPFDSTIWQSQIQNLPAGASGIAYDIRGFGKSKGGHHFYSIDLFAHDLLTLIDALGFKKVVLCGVSMGGYIALRAIEISPKAISGLILCDTNSAPDSNEGKLKRFSSIEQVLSNGTEIFASNFIKNLFSSKTISENPGIPISIQKIIRSTAPETICAAQLALASRTDTTGVLGSIEIPALIIRGGDDPLMTVEQAEFLHQAIKGSELKTVNGAGHLPNCEQPAEFNKILKTYLVKHFLS